MGETRDVNKISIGKRQRKGELGNLRCVGDENIKMHVKELVWTEIN
jgi:hypothetical protein